MTLLVYDSIGLQLNFNPVALNYIMAHLSQIPKQGVPVLYLIISVESVHQISHSPRKSISKN